MKSAHCCPLQKKNWVPNFDQAQNHSTRRGLSRQGTDSSSWGDFRCLMEQASGLYISVRSEQAMRLCDRVTKSVEKPA